MDLQTIIFSAVSAFFTFLATFLVQRRLYKKMALKASDDHLKTFYATLNKSMEDMQKRHSSEIDSLRREQSEERKQWAEERKTFNQKIDKLQDELRESNTQGHAKDILITQLNGKLELFQSRLDAYSDAYATNKNVTVNT